MGKVAQKANCRRGTKGSSSSGCSEPAAQKTRFGRQEPTLTLRQAVPAACPAHPALSPPDHLWLPKASPAPSQSPPHPLPERPSRLFPALLCRAAASPHTCPPTQTPKDRLFDSHTPGPRHGGGVQSVSVSSEHGTPPGAPAFGADWRPGPGVLPTTCWHPITGPQFLQTQEDGTPAGRPKAESSRRG